MNSRSKYGQWVVIAGASEGLGAAFAETLAARGHDLLLLARRAPVLATLADELRAKHKIEVKTLACDLADASFAEALQEQTQDLDVGIGVYNAAYSFVGPLLERPLEEALRVVDVNCRGPLRFVHALGLGMKARKRGGLVLMASLAGLQGSPTLATYAASKAFNIVLGESLWGELKPHGIDVLVSCAGAIRTPNYQKTSQKDAPGTLDPAVVAEQTINALGKGPRVVPGGVNKLASFVMGRLLPRSTAVGIMAKSTTDLS